MSVNMKGQKSPPDSGGDFTTGGNLRRDEFVKGIKSAEKGPFYSVQESMNKFEKWINEREKK